MVLPEWLEPLWGLWINARGATPPTKVKGDALSKLAANALNRESSWTPALHIDIQP